jgi:signal transduction histidine kinase/ActR/RegA family two-component response regulator/HAMP domain-containing protein
MRHRWLTSTHDRAPRPLRRQLLGIALLTTSAALLVTGLANALLEYRDLRRDFANALSTQARVAARSLLPALAFDDPATAAIALQALVENPDITGATVYVRGARYAEFTTAAAGAMPSAWGELGAGRHTHGTVTDVWVPAVDRGEVLGIVYLRGALRPWPPLLLDSASILMAALVSLVLAIALSRRLQARILAPLESIAEVARDTVAHRDYARRATVTTGAGEIGAVVRAFNAMLDEVESRTAALRESEARERAAATELRSVLDAAPAAILIARDRSCHVVTGSRGAHELLRRAPSANLSKSDAAPDRADNFRVLDADGRELAVDELPIQRVARIGRPLRSLRETIEFDDGSRRTLFGNVEPLFDAAGAVSGAVAAYVDITELELASRRLQEHQRALEQAARQKDEFLATLAHELRNPMAPIRYATALLRPDVAPAVLEQARRLIERQSAHMARLLDDLLDMSRITRNVIELKRSEVDLRTVVRDACEAAQPDVTVHRHDLTLSLPDEPAWVDGDPARLLQIVGNLLGNAVKYTPPGGRIAVTVELLGADLRLRVADSGIGLAPDMVPRVFDLFSQVHKGVTASHGGLGIGLAVVRRLVELHGGRVDVTSEGLGRGAEFEVVLPRTVPKAVAVATSNVTPLYRGPPRVLVVDDNRDVAQGLALLLRSEGIPAHVVHSGEDALALADELKPDVIVLDLGLPTLSGEQVAAALRERTWAQTVRIIAVTGWGQETDRARTAACGVDVHLVKPVDPAELIEHIRQSARAVDVAG